jgi:hypothetical protein
MNLLIINGQSYEIKDVIVADVCLRMVQRSQLGLRKYGTTLKENNTDNFLNHLFEELLDASLYIQKELDNKSVCTASL